MAGNYTNTLGLTIPEASAGPQQTLNPNDAFRGDQGASKLLGKLNRAQWEDWKARFSPYIDALAEAATDPNAAGNAASMASGAMQTAYSNSQRSLQMQQQGMGLSLDPSQQQASQRRQDVEGTAAAISAGNQARISAQDRQSAVLAGGLSINSIPDRVLNQ